MSPLKDILNRVTHNKVILSKVTHNNRATPNKVILLSNKWPLLPNKRKMMDLAVALDCKL
jgi:hypothetical protein